MDVLFLVMPAYNEQANIEKVIREWYPVIEGKDANSRLVVADYGSTDKTHEILEDLIGAGFSKLEILENDNHLHGPKLIALYDYAIKCGADFIFQTDSDGQTDPKEFDAFWNNRFRFDALIGNRTVRGDGISRVFVEKTVCLMLRYYFKIRVPDANAPFRLMKTCLVAKYIDRLPGDYFLPNIALTAFFSYYREQICFEEISFKPRAGGNNSINVLSVIKTGLRSMKEFKAFSKNM